MNELYMKKMALRGSYAGNKIKNQSDLIMSKTFLTDPHTLPVHVYHPEKNIDVHTYAKYQKSSKFSILKDQIDYHLQFQPKEHYPLGSYIDIPADDGTIKTWLLVGRDDNPQFVKYNILECNWTLKWIVGTTLYSQLGVLRNRNSYNSGIWNNGFDTSVENQIMFWVPSNSVTKSIYYDQRFLISDNREIPISWFVTKIEDTFPVGICKVILKQDFFNPSRDNAELMIADYYKDKVALETDDSKNIDVLCSRSEIDISSWKEPKIIIGSDYRNIMGKFYKLDEPIDITGMWTVDALEEFKDKIHFETDNNILKIKCDKDYSLVGQVITITFSDEENKYKSSLEIEVAAR